MSLFVAVIFLVLGLAVLWKCAELLVAGAVGLAQRLGVSPLVVGLTVVAMGTSAPEVAASIAAALRDMGDTAVGNVYGSNIANLALVGGLAALIRPIQVRLTTLRREIPVMLLVALLLWPILHNLSLSRLEGIALLAVFVALIAATAYLARREQQANAHIVSTAARELREAEAIAAEGLKLCLPFVAVGLLGLAVGADMAVRGAVVIGRQLGLSDAVIGLTIIAVGTSLPELATCVVAAIKSQHDISVGNLVGSNIFNTLLVVGAAGLVRPFKVTPRLTAVEWTSDYWIMIVVSAAFTVAILLGRRILKRPAGVVLLCCYLVYVIYLFVWTRAM